ncbi:hypothetical protein OQA88_13138 [Cercophora sp. LCS_1]
MDSAAVAGSTKPSPAHAFYKNLSLRKEAHEIRLLRIQDDASQRISCSLERVSLDDAPRYIALSYTWGKAKSQTPILVEGEPFQPHYNLYMALAGLRHITRDPDWAQEKIERIWIDAICINQDDETEKSWQLAQMRDVYVGAETVLIWLGTPDKESDSAMDMLLRAGRAGLSFDIEDVVDRNHEQAVSRVAEFITSDRGREPGGELEEIVSRLYYRRDAVEAGQDGYTTLTRFLNREWWSRVWVVQELSVARNPVFACGNKRLPWAEFSAAFTVVGLVSEALNRIAGQGSGLGSFPLGLSRFVPIDDSTSTIEAKQANRAANFQVWHRWQWKLPGNPLCEVLKAATHPTLGVGLGCTKEADMVYGLLGLCSNAQQLGIEINTAKPWQQIFAEVTQALIMQEGNLNLLSLRKFPNFGHGDLATWAVNWMSRPVFANPLYSKPLSDRLTPPFNAAGHLPRPGFRFTNGFPATLLLTGVVVGTVSETLQPFGRMELPATGLPAPEKMGEVSTQLYEIVLQVDKLIRRHPLSDTKFEARIPVATPLRVLLAGQYADESGEWKRLAGSPKEQELMACVPGLGEEIIDLSAAAGAGIANALGPTIVREAAHLVIRDLAQRCGADPDEVLAELDMEVPQGSSGQEATMAEALFHYDMNVKMAIGLIPYLVAEPDWVNSDLDQDPPVDARLQAIPEGVEDDVLMSRMMELMRERYPGGGALGQNPPMNPVMRSLLARLSLVQHVNGICEGRRVFALDRNLVGLGTEQLRLGDVVVVTQGAAVPLLLRPNPREGVYLFVGECYVDGIMDGEFGKKSSETPRPFAVV